MHAPCPTPPGRSPPPTCILSRAWGWQQALRIRYTCSMYSVIRCRKLKGSLKAMGMVILDSSCKGQGRPVTGGSRAPCPGPREDACRTLQQKGTKLRGTRTAHLLKRRPSNPPGARLGGEGPRNLAAEAQRHTHLLCGLASQFREPSPQIPQQTYRDQTSL